MKAAQRRWTGGRGWRPAFSEGDREAQLVLIFGATRLLREQSLLEEIGSNFPKARRFGCSTAGEICGTRVTEDSLVVTSITFHEPRIQSNFVRLHKSVDSHRAGELLARSFEKEGLKHVLVLSDGIHVNGSALVEGLAKNLPANVSVTGGLAGDGAHFRETLVLCDGSAEKNTVSGLGFYGSNLSVGYGSLGGWDPFGPERLVTRSKGNIVYEFDGKSALELYKKYLGGHAAGLPATGLLFPLSIRAKAGERRVVRTILAVNEEDQSLTFAGDVHEGSHARLMKSNFEQLIEGSCGAARTARDGIGACGPDLAILISCVGRKMLLKQRIEEEVEGVDDIFGNKAVLAGFYSYGEIAPFTSGTECKLHNQTMTITAFAETRNHEE